MHIRNSIGCVFIGLLLVMLSVISGCSPKLGRVFVEMDKVPEGKSLIYIY
jgi:hypothetical protein